MPAQHYAQILPIEFFFDIESAIEDDLMKQTEEVQTQLLPIRMSPNQTADWIFIESQVTLKKVTVNVSDMDGNIYLAYNFPVLSDLEMSLKSIPQGDYIIKVSNSLGTTSRQFER
jgi:hypothetical protein